MNRWIDEYVFLIIHDVTGHRDWPGKKTKQNSVKVFLVESSTYSYIKSSKLKIHQRLSISGPQGVRQNRCGGDRESEIKQQACSPDATVCECT